VGFFATYRRLYPVSRDVLRGAAEQFQCWVKDQADKWNAPIVEAPRDSTSNPLSILMLSGATSTLCNLAVRAYLRDEVKARGLRQSDVALSLGISRTQLVNILRGRFGASPRVTEDLKALAACLDAEIDDLAHCRHRERQIERPATEPPRQNRIMRPSGLLNVSTKYIEFTA
jgi:transcriptional regulator with XRE-family HTH domain